MFVGKVMSASSAVIAGMVLSVGAAADSAYISYPMMYMTLPDSDTPTVNFHALIEPTFRNSDENPVYDLNNDFSFDRLRIGFYGSYSRKVDYFFTTEFAPNAITNKTNGGGKAFVAHLTFKDVAGSANVAAGIMAIPMGYSFYAPSWDVPWINYADVEYNLYGCGSIGCYTEFDMPDNFFTNIWKPGLMVFDQLNLATGGSLTYTAGFYNTTGTALTDNRVSQKDFNGSLEYHHGSVTAMYGARIGRAQDVTVWNEERDRTRHAFTLMYNDFRKDRWWVWGEYMRGTDEQAAGVPDVTADGYFAAIGYKVTPKWELAYRHSDFDRNTDTSGDSRSVESIMLTYTMNNGIRLQAQQDFVDDEDQGFTGAIYPGDTFFIRASVPFFAKLM